MLEKKIAHRCRWTIDPKTPEYEDVTYFAKSVEYNIAQREVRAVFLDVGRVFDWLFLYDGYNDDFSISSYDESGHVISTVYFSKIKVKNHRCSYDYDWQLAKPDNLYQDNAVVHEVVFSFEGIKKVEGNNEKSDSEG